MTTISYANEDGIQIRPRYTLQGSNGTLQVFKDRICFSDSSDDTAILLCNLKNSSAAQGILQFEDGLHTITFEYEHALKSALQARIILSYCRREAQLCSIAEQK